MRLAPGFRIGASFGTRFSDDGDRLAVVSRTVTLWDVHRRRKLGKTPHVKHPASAAFTPDGSVLAVKSTAGHIVVCDAATFAETGRVTAGAFGEGAPIRIAPDGGHVVDGSWNGELASREIDTGAVVWCERFENAMVTDLTHDSSRRRWAYIVDHRGGSSSVFLRVWPFDGHDPTLVIESSRERLHSVALSADGDTLAVAGHRSLDIWSVAPWTLRHRVDDVVHRPGPSISLSPDGSLVAVAYTDGVRVLSLDGEALMHVPQQDPGEVEWSPTGTLLAAGEWGTGVVLAWPPLES